MVSADAEWQHSEGVSLFQPRAPAPCGAADRSYARKRKRVYNFRVQRITLVWANRAKRVRNWFRMFRALASSAMVPTQSVFKQVFCCPFPPFSPVKCAVIFFYVPPSTVAFVAERGLDDCVFMWLSNRAQHRRVASMRSGGRYAAGLLYRHMVQSFRCFFLSLFCRAIFSGWLVGRPP